MTDSAPPLSSLRVIEFAGLAPGPFAGKLLADFGAHVLRIDRHSTTPTVTPDRLAAHKRSLCVDLKTPAGVALVRTLAHSADVIIDPFRPGVLEKLGLGPETLRAENPRLVYARMAGFRRDGKYSAMAGHDINYIAVSGALSMLGRAGETPQPPGNLLGDFAGGGMVCFVGILLALLARARSGKGQVVEANMVDGAAYLASFPRFLQMSGSPTWGGPRGRNLLDGGAPFYDTYRTRDGGFVAVGALEPQFYKAFIAGLLPGRTDVPDRGNPRNWPKLRELFTKTFLEKDRKEWEAIFDGTDACVTPVKTHKELKEEKDFDFRPVVTLSDTPALSSDAWMGVQLKPGDGGSAALREWWGLVEGREWAQGEQGAVLLARRAKAKL